jgi:hypothetical protein
MLAAAPDDTYPIIYEAVLDSVALNRPSSDSLFKFTPLLTPSLDRAIDLHAEAVVDDGSQFETFAARPHLQASLHPLLAFTKFWRNTYAQSSLDIVYPPELDSRLSLIKKLAQDVKETQPQDSQLYSQLEESVRTFSFADERGKRTIPPSPCNRGSPKLIFLHCQLESNSPSTSIRRQMFQLEITKPTSTNHVFISRLETELQRTRKPPQSSCQVLVSLQSRCTVLSILPSVV